MTSPTIEHAREFGRALGARGIVVLVFGDDDNTIAGASWGRTCRDCMRMGLELDDMIEAEMLTFMWGKR